MKSILLQIVKTVYRVIKGRSILDSPAYNPEKIQIVAETIAENLLISATIVALFTLFWKRKRSWITQAVVVLTIIDLFIFSKGNLITMPFNLLEAVPAQEWLRENQGQDRFISTSGNLPYTGLGVYWTHLRAREPFSPNQLTSHELVSFDRLQDELSMIGENQGIRSRIFDASGYAAAVLKNYVYFWEESPTSPNAIDIGSLENPKLDLVGVKYIVTGFPQDFIKSLDLQRFSLVFEEGTAKIYENRKAWPRVFSTGDDPVPLKVLDYQPTRIVIETESDQPEDLVLTDTYYPGWVAKVDGEAVAIKKYKQSFRLISLPSGTHHVEFIFTPRSVKVGAIISLSSLIAMIYIWVKRPKKSQ